MKYYKEIANKAELDSIWKMDDNGDCYLYPLPTSEEYNTGGWIKIEIPLSSHRLGVWLASPDNHEDKYADSLFRELTKDEAFLEMV